MVFSWGVEIGRCKGTMVLAKSEHQELSQFLKAEGWLLLLTKARGQKKEF